MKWHAKRCRLSVLNDYTLLIITFISVFGGILSATGEKGSKTSQLDPKKCLVWGTGLQSEIVLPARHFYIQTVAKNGENLTESSGEDALKAQMTTPDGRAIAARWDFLDRQDGSYIFRYKLVWSSPDQDLHIKLSDKFGHPIAAGTYILKAPVYHEKCNCPDASLDKWMEKMKCPKSYTQIKKDLEPFPTIDMKKAKDEVIKALVTSKRTEALTYYVIKNNEIYRKSLGTIDGFKMFSDATLLSLQRKMRLPDMEFFMNLGDWPLVNKATHNDAPLPVISWCKSDSTLDIIMPTYKMTESTLEMLGRNALDQLSMQAHGAPKWENKTDMAFFRGRDSRKERLDLVRMSQKHPDVIDAKLTAMFFFKDKKEEMGGTVKRVSFFDFFKHKYQINIDGTVAAYRLPLLLAGDSLVFKQDSEYYEHFYTDIKPFVHYVPFKQDLSDLLGRIQWAKDNQEKAKAIAKQGHDYATNHLLPSDVYCYHAVLFKEYAKRLTAPVEVEEGMELVTEKSTDKHDLKCCKHRPAASKDEL